MILISVRFWVKRQIYGFKYNCQRSLNKQTTLFGWQFWEKLTIYQVLVVHFNILFEKFMKTARSATRSGLVGNAHIISVRFYKLMNRCITPAHLSCREAGSHVVDIPFISQTLLQTCTVLLNNKSAQRNMKLYKVPF